ncbi:MAG: hypothetical protein CYG59_23735 [Chloroflexi bacterium]|nr:MAG: hypothetical protein CYG59_23735 [Chloroflexota bacterium]
MDDDVAEYIGVEEAAVLLGGITTRQAHRIGQQARTRQAGKRTLFHRADIEAIAERRGVDREAVEHARQYQPQPKTDLVPAGEMLDYIRDRDRRLEELQMQMNAVARENGYLRGQLEQRLLPEDAAALRQRVAELEAAEQALRMELEQARKRWWQFWK